MAETPNLGLYVTDINQASDEGMSVFKLLELLLGSGYVDKSNMEKIDEAISVIKDKLADYKSENVYITDHQKEGIENKQSEYNWTKNNQIEYFAKLLGGYEKGILTVENTTITSDKSDILFTVTQGFSKLNNTTTSGISEIQLAKSLLCERIMLDIKNDNDSIVYLTVYITVNGIQTTIPMTVPAKDSVQKSFYNSIIRDLDSNSTIKFQAQTDGLPLIINNGSKAQYDYIDIDKISSLGDNFSDIIDNVYNKVTTLENDKVNYNIKTYTLLSQLGLSDSDFSATDWESNATLILSKMPAYSTFSLHITIAVSNTNLGQSIISSIGITNTVGNITIFKSISANVPCKFVWEVNFDTGTGKGSKEYIGVYDNVWQGWYSYVRQDEIINPNLLINSNFKVSELVNQRGLTNYDLTDYTNKYIFDMFKIYKSNGDDTVSGYVDLTGDRVRLIKTNNGANSPVLIQSLENYKNFRGKTVTLSAKVKGQINDKFALYTSYDNATKGYKQFTINNTDFNIYQITVTVSENTNNFFIMIANDTFNSTIEIDYIKLEEGSIATKLADDDRATKLSKCQRYLQKAWILQSPVIADSGNQIVFLINTKTTMRINNVNCTLLHNMYIHGITDSTFQAVGVAGDNLIYAYTDQSVLELTSPPLPITLVRKNLYVANPSNSSGNILSASVGLLLSAEI